MNDSSRSKSLRDVSIGSQRARLLKRLQAGPVNTFEAMSELNICRPGARISELRGLGHRIGTHLTDLIDAQGFRHPHCAVYYLTEGSAA